MRKIAVAIIALAMPGILLAVTMTKDQFAELMERGQFILSVWQGIMLAVIAFIATLLWRQIQTTKTESHTALSEHSRQNDIRIGDLDRFVRHEVRDIKGATHNSMTHFVETERRFGDTIAMLTERIAKLEERCNALKETGRCPPEK